MAEEARDDVLILYVCGELDGDRQAELERQTQSDPVLAARLRDLEATMAAVRSAADEMPSADFNAALRARLADERASASEPPRRPGRLVRLLELAAAAGLLLAVLLLSGVLGRPTPVLAWEDVVAAVEAVDQFHITALLQDDGREFRIDVYYRDPATWRAHGMGIVQFVRPVPGALPDAGPGEPEARFYDVAKRRFVERGEIGVLPLPDFATRMVEGPLLEGLLRLMFRGELPPEEPVRTAQDAVRDDLEVFDYAMEPQRWWARIWVLKESRLPLRMKVFEPSSNHEILVVFDYSDPQPERFFDPDAFAAEVKERRLTRDRTIYHVGQDLVGGKPRDSAQMHEVQGYVSPELMQIATNAEGDLMIVTDDPGNKDTRGNTVDSHCPDELRDNWGNVYVAYGSGTNVFPGPPRCYRFYVPVPPFREGEGGQRVGLRYVVDGRHFPEDWKSREISSEWVPVPAPLFDGFPEEYARWATTRDRAGAVDRFLNATGTLRGRLDRLQARLAQEPDSPAALRSMVYLMRRYDRSDEAYRLFERELLEPAMAGLFVTVGDWNGLLLGDYIAWLVDKGREEKALGLVARAEAALQPALKRMDELEAKDVRRKMEERRFGIYMVRGLRQTLADLEAARPKLTQTTYSSDGYAILEFDHSVGLTASGRPHWGWGPAVGPVPSWRRVAVRRADGRALLVAHGSGDELRLTYRPQLLPNATGNTPTIRRQTVVPVPAPLELTGVELMAERFGTWDYEVKPPSPPASRYDALTAEARDHSRAGRRAEAMACYEEALLLPVADFPERVSHPENRRMGVEQRMRRELRLDVARCLTELGRLPEAEAYLAETAAERRDLREIEDLDARRKERGKWTRLDAVLWDLWDAQEAAGAR